MSISTELTRMAQNVGALNADTGAIIEAIAAKGVTVPSGTTLHDCPSLISSIEGAGSFSQDNIVNIVPINKMAVVDSNGYIGFDLTNFFQYRGSTYYYNYAILSTGDDFSSKGLDQVTFYTPASNNIGGRVYNTVVIGGKEWMAENLDFKFSGLAIGQESSSSEPRANYYQNNEATYGVNGNKYGLLYNWIAVKYLEDHKAELIPGWHVPTKAEYIDLFNAVGGTSVAGTKLKSTTGWASGNGDGSYGFAAYPAGYRNSNGFHNLGSEGHFWTVTVGGSSGAEFYFNTGASITWNSSNNSYCESVRLVKDSA